MKVTRDECSNRKKKQRLCEHPNFASVENAKNDDDSSPPEMIDKCTFCSPLRCHTCEKRVSIVPSILMILLNNKFIGGTELGALASTCKTLQEFIFAEKKCPGEEIWTMSLLGDRW